MKTLLYLLMWPILHLYSWLLLKLNIQHGQPLPRGSQILVANHPTTADPFFVAWLAGGPSCILITEHAFKVPLFGAYLRYAGHIPVALGNGRTAFAAAVAAIKAGRKVIIFPEGDLSPRDGLCKAHSGVARLALLTGAPVIPVGIALPWEGVHCRNEVFGTETVISRWPVHTPYAMTMGNPLYFSGDANDRAQVAAVTDAIMQHIVALIHQSKLRLHPGYRGFPQVATDLAG